MFFVISRLQNVLWFNGIITVCINVAGTARGARSICGWVCWCGVGLFDLWLGVEVAGFSHWVTRGRLTSALFVQPPLTCLFLSFRHAVTHLVLGHPLCHSFIHSSSFFQPSKLFHSVIPSFFLFLYQPSQLIHCVINVFIHSFLRSLIRSFILSSSFRHRNLSTVPFIHSFIHSFILFFQPSKLFHSVIPHLFFFFQLSYSNSLAVSFIHSFIYSFIHSFLLSSLQRSSLS